MGQSILVIDNEASTHCIVKNLLANKACDIVAANNSRTALDILSRRTFHVTLLDMHSGDTPAIEVLDYALRQCRSQSVIVLSKENSVAEAVLAMKHGASDFLAKPLNKEILNKTLEDLLGNHKAEDDLQAWRQQFAPDLLGDDPHILQTLQIIKKIASSHVDVLITGASGTGKEMVARCIHMASRRSAKPFNAINCAAIPKELIESEMFGHAKGAFTGANEKRRGRVEATDGGTLFLDELGEMELSLQSKFLRVIQEREITPVGDHRTIKIDIRIISATNQDLQKLCEKKLFREDLLFRLNVVPIHLPSLAERSSDIVDLALHFIERANHRHGRRLTGLSSGAKELLRHYSWPGNIRELKNLIERLVVLKDSNGQIVAEDLPDYFHEMRAAPRLAEICLPEYGLDICEAVSKVEINLTLEAMKRANNCKSKAAELLGLKRTTLVQRLKKMNLEKVLSTDS